MGQLICEECGFRGIAGLSLFDRLHCVQHDEHGSGVRLRHLDRFEHVGAIRSFRILLVRPDSGLFARRRAERVSRRAIREPINEGGYDKPTFYAEDVYQIVPEMHSHALLLASDARGVGLVVIERRERSAWFRWSELDQGYRLDSEESGAPSWSVVHVWLLPTLRRRGLATELLEHAFRGFRVDPPAAGWLPPFTSRGFRLLRHFTPFGFWHSGYTPPAGDSFSRPFEGSAPAAG